MSRAWLFLLGALCCFIAARMTPAPTPDPEPVPVVQPPFATDRLTVLIVEDRLADQPIAIGADLYKWTQDNGVPFRVFHQDADMSQADEVWRKAMGAPRDSIPWLYAVNGSRFYSGPPPKTTAEIIALIEKYK